MRCSSDKTNTLNLKLGTEGSCPGKASSAEEKGK